MNKDGRGIVCEDTDAINRWIAHLTSSLAELAATPLRCPGLRCQKLKARLERFEMSGHQRHGFMMVTPLTDLLSIRHLYSLDFDTAGSYPLSWACDSDIHFCRSINALLPSLRRLRCRMDRICECLLEPPPDETALKLEEVIINFSPIEWSARITSIRYPYYCQTPEFD